MHFRLHRLIVFSTVPLFGGAMVGCVPAKNYDEARTAAVSEVSAHGRTRARLEAAHRRIRELEEQLSRREQEIALRDSSLAESRLEMTVANKERETATLLVEQLRSELARTGSHLLTFSDEKRDLERALVLAEERLKAIEAGEAHLAELVATTRDLTTALGDAPAEGVAIGARDGRVALSVPASKLFGAGSDGLLIEAAPLLQAVAAVSAAHPGLRVIVTEPQGAPRAAQRAERLGAALRERGIAEARIVLPVRVPSSGAPAIAPAAVEGAPIPDADAESSGANDAPPPDPAADAPPADGSLVYQISLSP